MSLWGGALKGKTQCPIKSWKRYILKSSLWLRSEVTFHRDLQVLSVRAVAVREAARPRASVLLDHRVQLDFSRLGANSSIRPLPPYCHLRFHIAVQSSPAGQLELMGGAHVDLKGRGERINTIEEMFTILKDISEMKHLFSCEGC